MDSGITGMRSWYESGKYEARPYDNGLLSLVTQGWVLKQFRVVGSLPVTTGGRICTVRLMKDDGRSDKIIILHCDVR